MIRTTCPQCGREDAIADYLASLPVMCKSCGHRVTMGEPIAPPKPVLAPPPPPKPVPPAPPPPPPKPLPPPVVAVSPLPPKPKPEPAPVVHTVAHAASHSVPADSPLNLSEWPADQPTVPLDVRASFANAVGPGVVDLFDDVPVPESRTERPPFPPLPPPPPHVSPPNTGLHRGRRFAARLVTLAGAVVALFAGIMLAAFAPNVVKNDPRMHTAFLFVPFGLYALYNVVLLAKHGQDFGKRAMKLRVVGDEGTPAGFGRAFLRRELVVFLLLVGIVPLAWKLYQMQKVGDLAGQWQRAGWQMFLPNRMKEVLPAVVAGLFSLMNALMIFNKDGKCIHDRLAKTRVTRG